MNDIIDMSPELDRPLVYFFEDDKGKAALSALMACCGYNDLVPPETGDRANYRNGAKAMIARILIAYERVKNPSTQPNPNPLGFS